MNKDFIVALDTLEKEQGIAKETLLNAIEDALLSSYMKKYNTIANVVLEINRQTGALKVFSKKLVVEDVIDERLEISLEQARTLYSDIELDEYVNIEVTPGDFGRIAVTTAKNIISQRIKEATSNLVYSAYLRKEGEMITGTVAGVDHRNVYVRLEHTEAILPITELVPHEKYKIGDSIEALILRIDKQPGSSSVILSRSNSVFLKRLMENRIPELRDGVVVINSIAREAGSRSKVAVSTVTPGIDAVACCVGHGGRMINSISSELQGEKIDIIHWSSDNKELISNALSPARVIDIHLSDDFEQDHLSQVEVAPDQLTLAIGTKGQNVRLAARLTGFKIDIKTE